MKVLIVSDEEVKRFYEYYQEGVLSSYDLILSCGDLSPKYLSFLATMSHAEVLYVHGNHDKSYLKEAPEGCTCIEDRVYNYRGLRILGLGGSMKYRESPFQFTEKEMQRRVRRLFFRLHRSHGFDILLTHAPAFGLNDAEDLPHRGYQCFLGLLDRYTPRYFIHGHVHKNYGKGYKKLDHYKDTTVINACQFYELEIPDEMLKK